MNYYTRHRLFTLARKWLGASVDFSLPAKGTLGWPLQKAAPKVPALRVGWEKTTLIQQETMDELSQDNQRGMGQAVLFLSSFYPCLLYVLEISLPDCWGDAEHKLSTTGQTALKQFNLFSFLEYTPEWVVSHLDITLQAPTSQHWHPKGLTLQKKIEFNSGVANLMQIWRTLVKWWRHFELTARQLKPSFCFANCRWFVLPSFIFSFLLPVLVISVFIAHSPLFPEHPIIWADTTRLVTHKQIFIVSTCFLAQFDSRIPSYSFFTPFTPSLRS